MTTRQRIMNMIQNGRFKVTIGAMNILGWHHTEPGGKNASMEEGVIRALRAVALWNVAKCWIVIVTEMEKIQADAIEHHTKWRVVTSEVNNRSVGHPGNWMATAICYKSRWLKVLQVVDLETPLKGRPLGLHMPAVRFKIKFLPIRFWVIGIHFPRTGGLEDAKASINARNIAKETHKEFMANHRGPFFIGGDGNIKNLDAFYGLLKGVVHSVQAVIGSTTAVFSQPRVGDSSRVSDHKTWVYVTAKFKLSDWTIRNG